MDFSFLDIGPDDPIVILTGAGISRESGLDTFRDPDGIWARHDLEEVATPEGFARDPKLVHAFYNARRRGLLDPVIQPNAAHRALARLEREWPGGTMLVTQNIDDLHGRAGSRPVHMHGELLKARCGRCEVVTPCEGDLSPEDRCAACGQTGGMRPDVVWFGEMPMHLDRIYPALGECGLFLSIGTSGTVYPAAGFVQEASVAGRALAVELNLEPSVGATLFDHAFTGPATALVPAFVDALLARR
ncbi:NAD-dependent deacylase [Inquilinus sp. CAU 1745]|uniref:NAD-dependent deacylase n=1 Tax=Inquilinus sp. CAU 1745 TaxID=3140369 RepID=UPI00325A9AF2